MTNLGIFPSPKITADEIIAATKHFSEATITKAMQRLHGSDHYDSEFTKLVIATLMTGDERTTSELLDLEDHCPEEAAPYGHNLHHLIAIIRGLHEYEQYKDTPLDLTSEVELSKIVALMNITSILLRDFKNPPLIIENLEDYKTSKVWLDPEAEKLVLQYQEDVPFIIDHITDASVEILKGLQYLNWYKKQSLITIDDKTIDTLFSYLYITEAIRKHAYEEITAVGEYTEAEYLNDPELEDFIENNPREREDFIVYIEERGTSNIGAYQEWKNNGTALRTGAL